MTHKYCFEALDKTLRDICSVVNPKNEELPFGGKIVVLGGDFRQTLPVIPKGTREEIVMAAINSSYLTDFVQVMRLTINMRLLQKSNIIDKQELERFAKWILQIGEGTIGRESDRGIEVEIPHDLLIHSNGDHFKAIVDSTYPDLHNNISNFDYLDKRAILAPTLEIVEGINNYILSMLPGQEVKYFSYDSICPTAASTSSYDDIYPQEYLNSISISGLPNHAPSLKIGVPVMLLRNIDQSAGLCNGTRAVITQLGKRVLEAKVLTGPSKGNKILIPRMNLCPTDTTLHIKLQRKQFPVLVCFAM
ncbi:unnamed protein product, partial [Cuscuta epithymum]